MISEFTVRRLDDCFWQIIICGRASERLNWNQLIRRFTELTFTMPPDKPVEDSIEQARRLAK